LTIANVGFNQSPYNLCRKCVITSEQFLKIHFYRLFIVTSLPSPHLLSASVRLVCLYKLFSHYYYYHYYYVIIELLRTIEHIAFWVTAERIGLVTFGIPQSVICHEFAL